MSSEDQHTEDLPTEVKPKSGRELRQMALSTSATELGLHADAEFPHVYGVLTEFHIGEEIATVVAMRDGTASLYTTSTFGIIGGHGHEAVRKAAVTCTKIAGPFLEDSQPTQDFEYPGAGSIRLYFLTYEGARLAEAGEGEIYRMQHKLTPIFAAAQSVLTELRKVVENE
jgi:hypothetical protein